MTVSVTKEHLKITLSETETVKYNIDRIFFDENQQLAQRSLIRLLRIASNRIGFLSKAKDFAIEIYPVFYGGCEIYYIPEVPKINRNNCTIFDFNSPDSLFSAAEFLYKNAENHIRANLYKFRNIYRLVLFNAPESLSEIVALNFAQKATASLLQKAVADEYGCILCKDCAVEVLGKAGLHL